MLKHRHFSLKLFFISILFDDDIFVSILTFFIESCHYRAEWVIGLSYESYWKDNTENTRTNMRRNSLKMRERKIEKKVKLEIFNLRWWNGGTKILILSLHLSPSLFCILSLSPRLLCPLSKFLCLFFPLVSNNPSFYLIWGSEASFSLR